MDHPPPAARRVSLFGIAVRLLVAIAIIGAAGFYAFQQISSQPEPPTRQDRERAFTVSVITPAPAAFTPKIFAFGEVIAGRTIDIRSQVSGEVVSVSPNLAIGAKVAENETLVTIDPFEYDGALADAGSVAADARLQLEVANEQLVINRANLVAAKEQFDLATRDFERASALAATGSITDKQVDDRRLIVAQRRQTLEQTEGSIRVQTAIVKRQSAAITRAEWVVAQAERALRNTIIRAPFDAIVTAQSASRGRVITTNEVVAALYATAGLEVRFTLSDRQFGQLTQNEVIGRRVDVAWNVGPAPIRATGTVTRIGAEIDATIGGVEVFARLGSDVGTALRPGTFVEVVLDAITYTNALRLPETALYENDHVYRLEEGRMARLDVQLLARDGAFVIVRAGLDPGASIITTRLAQAGEGVRVNVEGQSPPQSERQSERQDRRRAGNGPRNPGNGLPGGRR